MKYEVVVVYRGSSLVVVEADNEENAKMLAKDAWQNGDEIEGYGDEEIINLRADPLTNK